jgi:kynurenine formamidase
MPPRRYTRSEFDSLFERLKTWGQWGPDDDRGTMNWLTPDKVVAAARLVRTGRSISMALPINKHAGPDNPEPAVHHMARLHDIPLGDSGQTLGLCALAMAAHGDAHTHVDALNHVGYRGQLYNGRPVSTLTSKGSAWGSILAYENGVVGRGVLLDAARHRGVDWLEPGESVGRAELEAIEERVGVTVGEGDVLVFRTGHHARRLARGPWSNDYPPAGHGKAGLDLDAVEWMRDRRVAAFLPDGDGETIPAGVEGIPYPVHILQIVAMGMCVSDSLNLEDIADACAAAGRWEFLVAGLPLRLPGATGTPWNPVAIL